MFYNTSPRMQPKWIKMDSSFLYFFFFLPLFFISSETLVGFLCHRSRCCRRCHWPNVIVSSHAKPVSMQDRINRLRRSRTWHQFFWRSSSPSKEKKALVIFRFRFSDGGQNKSGKVAVSVDSFAINQLKQKSTITLLSEYNYIILSY